MLSSVKNIAFMLTVSLSVALFYYTYTLYKDNKILESRAAQAELLNDQLKRAINDLTTRITNQQLQTRIIEQHKTKLNTEYNKQVRKYDDLKNRTDVIKKKQTLVESKINKSFESFQNEMGCATGDTNLCVK